MKPAVPAGKFQIGDVVAVRKGVRDPDFDLPIGGWQGTVESFETGEDGTWLYCVAWDSITLLKIRRKAFDLCIRDGLDWCRTFIYERDLKSAQSRDTQLNLEQVRFGLELSASWHRPVKPKAGQ
jgi:hypothetical protein